MLAPSFHIAAVIIIILAMIVVMVTDKIKTSWVFLGTILALLLTGVLQFSEFMDGVSNPSIAIIITLIVITAGINDHFNFANFFERLFGNTASQRTFILRMGISVSAVSALMNNTPVVAMMMPHVYQWGKKRNINPSRLLMPLSFSAILGGVITLIGTSTNLVLNGLLGENGQTLLRFSDFLLPGLLVALGCLLFMFIAAPWLMNDNKDVFKSLEEKAREYMVEATIRSGSGLIGMSIQDAGLRRLESVFVTEIVRDQRRISPVKPSEILQEGDSLLFAGETKSTLSVIQEIDGLELKGGKTDELQNNRLLIEAIVTQNSALDHKTVKDSGFREKFDAAIIGIHRMGEKVTGKIGAIPLKTGDLLLITAGSDFHEKNNRTNDLLIVNTLTNERKIDDWKLITFVLVTLGSVALVMTGVLGLMAGLFLILLTQLFLGMINMERIKKNISLDLLSILVAALALGKALINSGAADYLSELLFADAHSWNPLFILVSVFFATFVLTSLITNVAAITIIFPIVYSLASMTAVPPTALYLTAAFAASCCFATPFAYQTNLMVMEAGNYRFRDFLKMGVPLSIVYAIIYLTFAAFNFNLL